MAELQEDFQLLSDPALDAAAGQGWLIGAAVFWAILFGGLFWWLRRRRRRSRRAMPVGRRRPEHFEPIAELDRAFYSARRSADRAAALTAMNFIVRTALERSLAREFAALTTSELAKRLETEAACQPLIVEFLTPADAVRFSGASIDEETFRRLHEVARGHLAGLPQAARKPDA